MTKEEIQKNSEHWYNKYKDAEKRITDLENKIADIKANCNLAIEGRDIKIKELEETINKLREQFALRYSLEDKIEKLEKENKTLEGCLLAEQEHTQMLEQQIEKMKADVKQGQSYWNSGEMQYDLYQRLLDKWEIKENDTKK